MNFDARMTGHESTCPPLWFVSLLVATMAGCSSAYYGAMEKVGYHKRDILVSRVESAMTSQEEAKEEFKDAYERFASVVSVPASELERTYRELSRAFERAESSADEVRQRIESVASVSGALFDEWRDEIEQIGDRGLRSASARQLRESRARYGELMQAMQRAEKRMDPVLATFRDYVLFLKHNLNARAIASLQGELAGVEADVGTLIRDMEASIGQARDFIASMDP
jgi:DNA helicase HerA-like ATPase